MIRYASVCSGIGAPECTWSSLGWQCEFAAEIEAFPSAVYAHHFPKVPNYGDITKFKEWPQHAIDVLVAGTPCQAFSVAGLRKGMADLRGNLTLTFLAIVGKYAPAWVVWENVPGVLSIDQGRAFGSFLGGLAELGYGFAYRVLDAQYFGVAQRRRRVFVVGHAGGQWQRAAAVLFERESMCGNPAPRRETGQRIAPTISSRTKGGGGLGTDADCDGAVIPLQEVNARKSKNQNGVGIGIGNGGEVMYTLQSGQQHGIAHSLRADGFDASEDGTGRGTPLVFDGNNTQGSIEIAPACQAHGGPQGRISFESEALIAFNCKDHGADAGQLAPTLRACPHDKSHANSGAPPAIAFNVANLVGRAEAEPSEETFGTIGATKTGGAAPCVAVQNETLQPACEEPAHQTYAVRRLTPKEAERLQGFPDGYTAIYYRGKPACDGPRYKALGNSMAVPVLKWIGQRIELVHEL